MPHLRADATPRRVGRTVCELDQIQRVLDHAVQTSQRNALQRLFELAGHARREDRQRLRANVFRELKVLEETESVRLPVAPAVPVDCPALKRSDRALPVIEGFKVGALHHAAAGKSQRGGLHLFKHLHQIAAQAILAVVEGGLREERHQIEIHRTGRVEQHDKLAVCRGLRGQEHRLVFHPLRRRGRIER